MARRRASAGQPPSGVPTLAERVLAVAEALVARHGLAAFKVRDVAAGAGCSIGSVYNAYADLDELVVAVNRRTLLRLDARLEDASRGAPPERVLHALTKGYLAFAAAETHSLRALFEHRMKGDRPAPDDHLRLVDAVFSRIATPLASRLPVVPSNEVAMLARTLFSAVHGIIALGLEERLVAVPPAELERQVMLFVDVFEAGLGASAGPKAVDDPLSDDGTGRPVAG